MCLSVEVGTSRPDIAVLMRGSIFSTEPKVQGLCLPHASNTTEAGARKTYDRGQSPSPSDGSWELTGVETIHRPMRTSPDPTFFSKFELQFFLASIVFWAR